MHVAVEENIEERAVSVGTHDLPPREQGGILLWVACEPRKAVRFSGIEDRGDGASYKCRGYLPRKSCCFGKFEHIV
jgi:hypothetical protein